MNQPNYAPPSKKAHGMEIVHIIGPAHVAKIVFFSTAECSPISQTLVSGNYASTLEYNVGTLAAGMAKTIQLYYARF
jgi:hypothetical protein